MMFKMKKAQLLEKAFLIDENGILIKIWDKVKAATHGQEVLDFLDE